MAENLKPKLGIWHATTVELARQRQQTYSTTAAAGQKRAHDSQNSAQSGPPPALRHLNRASLSGEMPRLPASRIQYVDGLAAREAPSEYSQRQAFAATPTSTTDPLLSLSHPAYGLPPQLVANFAASGIKSIYPWQKQCLLGPGLLRGDKNLVYSAPTGGGKSLVADVLMLKRVLEDRHAKAVLVLPYVALVQEKVRWLQNIVNGILRKDEDEGQEGQTGRLWARRADKDTIRVVGCFGGSKVRTTWADFNIAVCTIEKASRAAEANSLVNAAIEDCSISSLRAVVLDECHMIDDGYRGYLLELMATKLLCLGQPVQIVGMSATLTNIGLLKDWLQGHSYETHYRPIPIEEHLVYDGRIYAAGTTASLLKTVTQLDSATTQHSQSRVQPVRLIEPSAEKELKDPVRNAVVALANETVRAGYGVLVFSSSRAGCESDAVLISRVLPTLAEADPIIQEKRLDLLGDLRSLPTGLDPKLEQTIPCGVAFHQAGLTTEEQELVAKTYDQGVLKVCVATCSLAAGINLPARRVILHNARMGRDLVGPGMLRQMRGRAGRKGKDEVGETYLCCRQSDLEAVVDLMHADLPELSSCLISDKRRIQRQVPVPTRRALLEIIAIRLATSRESLDDYVSKTLLAYSAEPESIQEHVEASIADLQKMEFITIDDYDNFQATLLGKAIVASSLDPEDGIFIHDELKKALQAFVLDGEMHVLYNFTPVQDLGVINWKVFWNEMQKLDDSGFRVLHFLGLKPVVVDNMQVFFPRGSTLKETTPEEKEAARRYHRFYLALQLRDLCNEMPIHRVAQKYDMPRGSVQTLAQTCQGFAAGMIKFCETMGWGAMAAALDHFSGRLKAGARSDLLALAKITFVKSRTARIFWDNGFKTVAVVANADPKELLPVLMQAQPNKVRLGAKDEQKFREKLLAKARIITDSANRIWREQPSRVIPVLQMCLANRIPLQRLRCNKSLRKNGELLILWLVPVR
ncbi:P-loop containing nucleoside triphosphate hydrolase protein [Parathielavia hyrcaniae]|uniref:P-loop containing nucleoside triphosphate hydrolase protein n=1 Tax=Parathielavia hyrcaniae TaxID=113614 RepID=A0AAN6Q8F2_9PEZI|nr:P-loop containing nucleoside triphosphate hydrolase protein [Parathielavia hyrcaniae]